MKNRNISYVCTHFIIFKCAFAVKSENNSSVVIIAFFCFLLLRRKKIHTPPLVSVFTMLVFFRTVFKIFGAVLDEIIWIYLKDEYVWLPKKHSGGALSLSFLFSFFQFLTLLLPFQELLCPLLCVLLLDRTTCGPWQWNILAGLLLHLPSILTDPLSCHGNRLLLNFPRHWPKDSIRATWF